MILMMQMKRKMNRQACVDGIFDSCPCLTTPKIVSHPGGPWLLSSLHGDEDDWDDKDDAN